MASVGASVPSMEHPQSGSPHITSPEADAVQSEQISSTPIEMNPLPSAGQPEGQQTSMFGPTPEQEEHNGRTAIKDAATRAVPGRTRQIEDDRTSRYLDSESKRREYSPSAPSNNISNNISVDAQTPQPQLTRMETAAAAAIGPATDGPTATLNEISEGPILLITLLLASSGARHPYKLDGKYLSKRQVEVEDSNPINMSLYKLKELILRDWRNGKKNYLVDIY